MSDGTRIYRCAAVRDAGHVDLRPGAVAVAGGRIVAVGTPDEVAPRLFAPAQVIDLPDTLLLPALVNAHAHLDLTLIGPRPYGGSFSGWVGMVLEQWARCAGECGDDPAAVRAAVARGAELSLEAGVATVGDIADDLAAIAAMRSAGLRGVSYFELFGIGGDSLAAALRTLDELARHAPAQQSPVLRLDL